MDDKMFEKRMETLNKSYERMPVKTEVSEVINAIENERSPKNRRESSFIGLTLQASLVFS
ncbi:hypothetical protein [Bacillus sp. SG-1]|uniref:hypothetical protein n=1 Tax=Bacillus sp. SG-1 TaxID=161544 RepID=UPI000154460B|nr:hypothetical protein [Bacillus sp. SG-1]EDL62570.1 hypothetical protein BSG1_14363 [Bacillus sp. SG-1]